jgi:hypothetical protein
MCMPLDRSARASTVSRRASATPAARRKATGRASPPSSGPFASRSRYAVRPPSPRTDSVNRCCSVTVLALCSRIITCFEQWLRSGDPHRQSATRIADRRWRGAAIALLSGPSAWKPISDGLRACCRRDPVFTPSLHPQAALPSSCFRSRLAARRSPPVRVEDPGRDPSAADLR